LKINGYLKFEILNAVNLKNIVFFLGIHLPKLLTPGSRRNSGNVTSDRSVQWLPFIHVSVIWKSNCWHGCYLHHI